jgi:hypothetical protein
MTEKNGTGKAFGEYVRCILMCGKPFRKEGSGINMCTNEVVSKVNMFGARVVGSFLR